MLLATTLIGNGQPKLTTDLLAAITDCQCKIVDFRTSQHTGLSLCFCLIEGNWNHLAKYENALLGLEKRYNIQIQTQRIETLAPPQEACLPYVIESLSLEPTNALSDITAFLFERGVAIGEIASCSYHAPYTGSLVYANKFIIYIPGNVGFLRFREDFFDFCDSLNIDAVLDILKR